MVFAWHIICSHPLGEQSNKKNWFFLDIVRTSETPPPINLDTQKFSVKENFGLSQTPPLLYEKYPKKAQFSAKYPKKMRYFAQFSAKTLLDWVRPPPLSAKKSKKI